MNTSMFLNQYFLAPSEKYTFLCDVYVWGVGMDGGLRGMGGGGLNKF